MIKESKITQQSFNPRVDLDPFTTLATFQILICDNLMDIGVSGSAILRISKKYENSLLKLINDGDGADFFTDDQKKSIWNPRLRFMGYSFYMTDEINGIMLVNTGSHLDDVDMTIEQFVTYCNLIKMIKGIK